MSEIENCPRCGGPHFNCQCISPDLRSGWISNPAWDEVVKTETLEILPLTLDTGEAEREPAA